MQGLPVDNNPLMNQYMVLFSSLQAQNRFSLSQIQTTKVTSFPLRLFVGRTSDAFGLLSAWWRDFIKALILLLVDTVNATAPWCITLS